MPSFDQLYSPTRTRLIGLLRRSERTIPELAGHLDVSSNAVRSHVSAMVSDGVVREVGVRREGVGKPARVYDLTTAARERLSRAYAPVLDVTVGVLKEELGAEEAERLLREVGRRVGRGASASGHLEERLGTAGALFEGLGGDVEVTRNEDRVTIRGAGCPLGAVVREHPEACAVARALLEEILGRSVVERCDRTGRTPSCAFEVRANGGGADVPER